MKSLKQQQFEYAKERILQIKKIKVDAAREMLTTEGTHLSDLEKLDLIRRGDVFLRSKATLSLSLMKAFDFSAYVNETTTDDKALDLVQNKVVEQASKLLDRLYFGDTSNIIEAIEAFEATEFCKVVSKKKSK